MKQGLNADNHNPQLMKQLQTIKKKKAASVKKQQRLSKQAGTVLGGTGRGLDASVSKELMDLQQQYVPTSREYQTVQANIVHAQKEIRSSELTQTEVEKLEADNKLYRGIGKMFMLSSKDHVMEHLTQSVETSKKREKDLTQKMEYLGRRLKSQEQNMEELTKTSRASS